VTSSGIETPPFPSDVRVKASPSFLRRHPNLIALLLGLFMVQFCIGILELAFFFLNRAKVAETGIAYVYEPVYLQKDALLGVKPAPSITARHARFLHGQPVFDANYTFDAHSRRVVPEQSAPPEKTLLFFGCSITFGTGVEDSETLPAQTVAAAPGWRAFNYAFQGYGPQQMLAKLEDGKIAEEIGGPADLGVYVVIPDHARRAIGAKKVVCQWAYGADYPYYDYDGQGNLRHFGSFATGRPWRQRFYQLLHREQCLRYFEVEWPPWINTDHLDLTAEIIEASAQEFSRQFPAGRFYVLLFPGDVRYSETSLSARTLIPFLEARGIPYVDYSDAFPMYSAQYAIPGDGHPTPAAYREIARRIAGDLLQ